MSVKDTMNKIIEQDAIIEAIEKALEGEEPDDFMMSFGVVRNVWELRRQWEEK